MRSILFKKPVMVLIVLIALVSLQLHKNKRWGGNNGWCDNICSDGRGYYAWLPALFIYHDLSFHFTDTVEKRMTACGGSGGCNQEYRVAFGTKQCNKYYPGASFCQLPFFCIAHLYCLSSGGKYRPDGYTKPYFIMIGIGALVFMFIGLLYFDKLLVLLDFSVQVRLLTILFIFFGSNMLYYSIDDPSYSHIYSFALITFFLYQLLLFIKTREAKHLLLLAFFSGWILTARPVNATFLLMFPFLLTAYRRELVTYVLKNAPILIGSFLLFALLPCVLLCLYKISTGSFFIYSYNQEYFTFSTPHIHDFLFSYDNGLFLYMPAIGLSAITCLFSFRQNKTLILSSLLVILITVYIHSAWWCWWYGYAFGSRTLLDGLALFGILIAFSLNHSGKIIKRALITMYSLCCLCTMILYHQRHHGFLTDYPIRDYFDAIKSIFMFH